MVAKERERKKVDGGEGNSADEKKATFPRNFVHSIHILAQGRKNAQQNFIINTYI